MALRDNFFFVFASCGDEDEPVEVIRLERVEVIAGDEKVPQHSFHLKLRERSLLICAADEAIKDGWMKALIFAKVWYDEDSSQRPSFSPRRQNSVSGSSSSILRVARRLRDAF